MKSANALLSFGFTALLATSTLLVAQEPGLVQHQQVVTWAAHLKHVGVGAAADSPSSGKATFVVNFDRQIVTVNLELPASAGVTRIELRVARSHHDAEGPAISTLYSEKDGPLQGTFNRTISGPQFKEVADVIVNGRAVVEASTRNGHQGELAGRVEMHKSYH